MAKALGGNLPKDGQRIAVQAGRAFQTNDITGTPLVSPKVVSTTAIPLLVPLNAYAVIFYATANDCRISEEATAAANYFVLKAGQQITLGCATMSTIYLLRDAGADATVQFAFLTI